MLSVLTMGVDVTNGPIRLFKPVTRPLEPLIPFPTVTAPAFATVPLFQFELLTR